MFPSSMNRSARTGRKNEIKENSKGKYRKAWRVELTVRGRMPPKDCDPSKIAASAINRGCRCEAQTSQNKRGVEQKPRITLKNKKVNREKGSKIVKYRVIHWYSQKEKKILKRQQ